MVMLLQKNFLQSMDPLPTFDVIRVGKTQGVSAVWNLLLDNIVDMHQVEAVVNSGELNHHCDMISTYLCMYRVL